MIRFAWVRQTFGSRTRTTRRVTAPLGRRRVLLSVELLEGRIMPALIQPMPAMMSQSSAPSPAPSMGVIDGPQAITTTATMISDVAPPAATSPMADPSGPASSYGRASMYASSASPAFYAMAPSDPSASSGTAYATASPAMPSGSGYAYATPTLEPSSGAAAPAGPTISYGTASPDMSSGMAASGMPSGSATPYAMTSPDMSSGSGASYGYGTASPNESSASASPDAYAGSASTYVAASSGTASPNVSTGSASPYASMYSGATVPADSASSDGTVSAGSATADPTGAIDTIFSDPTLLPTTGSSTPDPASIIGTPSTPSTSDTTGADLGQGDPNSSGSDQPSPDSSDPNADPAGDSSPPADDPSSADTPATPADFGRPAAPADVPTELAGDPNSGDDGPGLLSTTNPPPTTLPATITTGGSYERHYTGTGSNATSGYSLDVVVESTLGTGVGGVPSETGTITYTVSTTGAVGVRHESDTVHFDNRTVGPFGTGFEGLNSGGALLGYDTASFGMGDATWDHQTWDDTVTFDASGSTPTGTGGPGYFTSHTTSTDSWYSDRTVTAGADGTSTEVVDSGYYNSYTTDVTVSDGRAGLDPDPAVLGGDGFPADQFAAPADGTTFLSRAFSTSSASGTDRRTTTEDPSDDDRTTIRDDRHDGYGGRSSARTFVNSTTTVGDGVGSSDRLTLSVDSRQTTTFGGAQHSDVALDFNGPQSGTFWATAHSATNTLADDSSVSDTYSRNGDAGRSQGVARSGRTASGRSSSDETVDQTYDDAGRLTRDTLEYTYTDTGTQGTTNSDDGNAVTPVRDASGGRIGQTTTAYDTSDQQTASLDSTRSGTDDRVDGTGTLNSTVITATDGRSMARIVTHYAAADGSGDYDARSLNHSTQGSTSDTTVLGSYGADGRQDDGTSNSTVGTSGSWDSDSWARRTPTNQPVTTLKAVGDGSSGASVTSDLTYNADGTANGTVTSAGRSVSTEDRKVWVRGTTTFTGGSSYVNDFDHRVTQTTGDQSADLTLLSDTASRGTTTSTNTVTITTDSLVYHTTDLADDSLHSRTFGFAHGSVTTTEVILTTTSADVVTAMRLVHLGQNGTSTSLVLANGRVSDADGHTGNWTYNATAGTSANDTVDVTLNPGADDWTEVGRTFSINDTNRGSSHYHLEDDGVGSGPTPAGATRTVAHVKDTATSSHDDERRSGTPSAYLFDWQKGARYDDTETRRESYANATRTESGTSSSRTVTNREGHDNRTGGFRDGVSSNALIDTLTFSHSCSMGSGVGESPVSQREYAYGTSSSFLERRLGDYARGTGVRLLNSGSLNWSRYTDRTAWWGGTTTMGSTDWVFAPERRDDLGWGRTSTAPLPGLWGTIGQDFANDPGTQWVVRNSGDLLQVANGVGQVVLGVATFEFGGLAFIVLGANDILTGVWNLASDVRLPSTLLEYGGYSLAQGLGAGEGASQRIGEWTPTVVSMAAPGVGGLFRGVGGLFRGLGAALEERAVMRAMQAEAGANLQLSARMNGLIAANSLRVVQYFDPRSLSE